MKLYKDYYKESDDGVHFPHKGHPQFKAIEDMLNNHTKALEELNESLKKLNKKLDAQ